MTFDINDIKNRRWILAISIVVIFFLILFFNKNSKQNYNEPQLSVGSTTGVTVVSTTSQTVSPTTNTNTLKSKTVKTISPTVVRSLPGICNITISNPVDGGSITFPLTINGQIDLGKKTDCVWNNNLSAGGSVELYYNLRNTGWKSAGIPVSLYTSTSGLSTSTLTVKASLNLYTQALGLTSGTPIKLVFTELNLKNISNPNTFSYITYLK